MLDLDRCRALVIVFNVIEFTTVWTYLYQNVQNVKTCLGQSMQSIRKHIADFIRIDRNEICLHEHVNIHDQRTRTRYYKPLQNTLIDYTERDKETNLERYT